MPLTGQESSSKILESNRQLLQLYGQCFRELNANFLVSILKLAKCKPVPTNTHLKDNIEPAGVDNPRAYYPEARRLVRIAFIQCYSS